MKYNELTAAHRKSPKRVGRGIAAGQGKTAGRGTKGQGARTGSSKKPGFEGGQNPLMQRLPKLHGFTSHRTPAENVFTDQLDKLGAVVDNQVLADKGLVSSAYVTVKLLKRGDVTKKLTVNLQAASETAVEAIQKAGGEFTVTARTPRPVTKKPKSEKK
ncbi:MAG: 50S ribosomal protein L15 [Candidatus Saccharibacteria bacterium]